MLLLLLPPLLLLLAMLHLIVAEPLVLPALVLQLSEDALMTRLPVECGDQGERLVTLLSVLKHLESFHRALSFIYIHCNYVEVRSSAFSLSCFLASP